MFKVRQFKIYTGEILRQLLKTLDFVFSSKWLLTWL